MTFAADESNSECGGARTADDTLQYITTPNWPDRYPENTTCVWVIEALSLTGNVQMHVMGINSEVNQDELTVSSTGSLRMLKYTSKLSIIQ